MSETIYIRNLDEKIKIDSLKESLKREFGEFGTVLDVVAHRNIRMRGQAFVVFGNQDQARKAMDSRNEALLNGKPMLIEFSQKPSDTTVKRQGPEELAKHVEERLRAKRENYGDKAQLKQSKPRKRRRQPGTEPRPQPQPKRQAGAASSSAALDGGDTTGASSRNPRNKVLFLENLPPGITQDTLEKIFGSFTGFFEVRLVAVRRVAFVEYENEDQAANAREATMGLVKDDHTIKITFAKR